MRFSLVYFTSDSHRTYSLLSLKFIFKREEKRTYGQYLYIEYLQFIAELSFVLIIPCCLEYSIRNLNPAWML